MTPSNVQTLLEVLSERGLRHWYEVAVDWAARFDGWRANYSADEALSPDDLPLSMATDAIRAIPSLLPAVSTACAERAQLDLACARALASADFVCWRAHADDGVRSTWDPFVEPFLSFSRGASVSTWTDDRTLWPTETVRVWLLGKLKEAELEALSSELQHNRLVGQNTAVRMPPAPPHKPLS